MAKAAAEDWMDQLAQAREGEPEADAEEIEEQPEAEAEEPAAKAEPEPKDDDDTRRSVPLAVLTAEREKFQAKIDSLESRLNQTNMTLEKASKIEDELRALREQQQAKAEPEPDYLDDPKAYIDHSQKSLVEKLRSIEESVKSATKAQDDTKNQLSQQQMLRQVQAAAAAAEGVFSEKHEDYFDALNHIRLVRANQLKLQHPQATDEQIQTHMAGEEFQTAAAILQQGRNPAEYAYNYAKSVGYTRGKQDAADPKEQERREDAKERARGMGNAGGGTDIEAMMGLPDDEFDMAMKEMFSK